MDNNVKWRKYLGLSLLLFAAFLLEYFALFVIEMLIMRMNIGITPLINEAYII